MTEIFSAHLLYKVLGGDLLKEPYFILYICKISCYTNIFSLPSYAKKVVFILCKLKFQVLYCTSCKAKLLKKTMKLCKLSPLVSQNSFKIMWWKFAENSGRT